jgi:hypothetical protein
MMERGKAYHIKYQFIRVQREGETREERGGVNQNCEEALCFLDLREREREREREGKRGGLGLHGLKRAGCVGVVGVL